MQEVKRDSKAFESIVEEYGKAIDIFPLIGLEEFLETPGWTTLDLARFGS